MPADCGGLVLPKLAPEVDVLESVSVRLLADGEADRFNHLLETEHYLASSRHAGQSLRYVAEVAGQWVALLTFSAPALQLKARERWIGWSPRQRARRLGLVVSNSRCLILPEPRRYPNLASRVLGMTLRRLSEDWQARLKPKSPVPVPFGPPRRKVCWINWGLCAMSGVGMVCAIASGLCWPVPPSAR